MVSSRLASLTAVPGGGHQEEPFFPAGRTPPPAPARPPLLPPLITTCPHILGEQLDNP